MCIYIQSIIYIIGELLMEIVTDPVQPRLVHALRVLLQFQVLSVHTQTLDVS